MGSYERCGSSARGIYVGVDVHLLRWQVTVMADEREVFSGSLGGNWRELERLLSRWERRRIVVAYEAGFSGFWLHDAIVQWGGRCIVVPPSLIPQESGSRIKTDRRDSSKLAMLLSRGILKQVWVPCVWHRQDREVVRQRNRLVRDRRRVQCQIKGLLHWYGLPVPRPSVRWSLGVVAGLEAVRVESEEMQASYERLLAQYRQVTVWLAEQTALVRQLAGSERYRDGVSLLMSIPGIGLITAMELLLELSDVSRFSRVDKLAAYVGLTPSQYSSGEHLRLGHITRGGKAVLRGLLVEAAWTAIRRDRHLAEVYERIKRRAGGKRAVVAVARRLLGTARAILLSGKPYRTAA